jgi:hypothetical protein
MSKHDHKHEHCKHEQVKYCQHCDVAYCRDCGHEWNDRPKGYWYPTTWYPMTVAGDTASGATITTSGYVSVSDGVSFTPSEHNHD